MTYVVSLEVIGGAAGGFFAGRRIKWATVSPGVDPHAELPAVPDS
jgi:hypothetical protein